MSLLKMDVFDKVNNSTEGSESIGQCISCGHRFVKGEIGVMESDGSGNAICQDCVSEALKTKISFFMVR